ncbi:MAG: DNA mismatch repair protein MutS [Saprospiraceae bacterium]
MGQYAQIKGKYPDAILLFRVGDFYETFGEDAITVARVVGIVQTKRNNGGSTIELAGFPYHSLNVYLPKLVRSGYRVAICEQMEKPTPGKVVKRAVTELITPGVITGDQMLEMKKNNFLASLYYGTKDQHGISFIDISTGDFYMAEGEMNYIDKLLQSFNPSEIILSKNTKKNFEEKFGSKYYTYTLDDWIYQWDFAHERLIDQFEVHSLKGFGVDTMHLGQVAAGAALYYLKSTENQIGHIKNIQRIPESDYVWLDRFTIQNLELLSNPKDTGKSFIEVLDQTVTPMGSRLMTKWVILPLINVAAIAKRHDVVDFYVAHHDEIEGLNKMLMQFGDLERLINKAAMDRISPREAVQLKRALSVLPGFQKKLMDTNDTEIVHIGNALQLCESLQQSIHHKLREDAPVATNKGGILNDGCDTELDELRYVVQHAQDLLIQLQQRESEKTGIPVKIGFNSVFGYYLEVTNKYKDQVPPEWVRKQTLANAERFLTDELKKLEGQILGAEEKIVDLEERLFRDLVLEIKDYIIPIQNNAQWIARFDCLLSFAKIAIQNKYNRPVIHEGDSIEIKQGRHPVIEKNLKPGEEYIPNDLFLDSQSQQILMITGPNMSGKSAILRQTALISLMAQMGSFVPAASASLGLIDKIFTRVGASDNISSGESTFMVEMTETSLILNNTSARSLILLDEIGRGTSTYDGISIAWAIAEHLHDHDPGRPKTLFATHYHELNELAEKHERIKNFHVATKELGNKVIFLRLLREGGVKHSFGIHVARMAGMPKGVIERAQNILKHLEQKSIESSENTSQLSEKIKSIPANLQLNIFESSDPRAQSVIKMLEETDIDRLSPVECLIKLNEIKGMLKG